MRAFACLASLLLTAPVLAALQDCRELATHDRSAADVCYRQLLTDASFAVRAEAAWALDDIPAADAAFGRAIRDAPDDAHLRTRWGELYRAVHKDAQAEALFQEALAIDPGHSAAKLGLAKLALGRFDSRAEELANEVLAQEPANAEARVLLARLALEVGDAERARQELREPLETEDLDARLAAMTLAAAIDHLADVVPSPWESRALALDAGYGELFETIAHFYIITRRYREAIAQLERAVAVDPKLWRAHGTLGMNLLRVNRFADARAALTRAHNGSPHRPEVAFTLTLLDSMADWDTLAEEGLVLRTHPDEAAALTPYVRRLVADAVSTFSDRYAFVPDAPVVIELYPHHDDFAVRTSGLPGIGILGATFGEVVVMDSPSARGIDEGFDWASVLWHEVAHVITLGATNNRVSRWFSEGVSVLEEWQTGPSRFQDEVLDGRPAAPLAVVEAFQRGDLLPAASLDEGFIRPRYQGQVGVSYAQAGLLCEFIAAAYGRDALAAMLAAYRQGDETPAAIHAALEIEPASLDSAFAHHLEQRFAHIDTGAFRSAVAQARDAQLGENWTAAAQAATAAIAAYPHVVGQPSPYPILAQAEDRLGDRTAAIDALVVYWRAGGRATPALAKLAAWLEEAGRDDALAVRRSLALVAPLHGDYRAQLGDVLLRDGRGAEALVEYRAYASLQPHDAAMAQYRLASAYHAVGEAHAARRHVLKALEIAPRFGDALALLLEINQ